MTRRVGVDVIRRSIRLIDYLMLKCTRFALCGQVVGAYANSLFSYCVT